MIENKLKEDVNTEESVEKPQPVRKKPSAKISRRFIKYMNSLGVFDRNQVVHSMPFILFVTVLLIGYIANSYYAESMIREIEKTKTEIKEKRAQYISTMAQLMYQRNQSQVAKSLQPFQIKESTQPPGKIFITELPQK
jgi:hypothetical protein